MGLRQSISQLYNGENIFTSRIPSVDISDYKSLFLSVENDFYLLKYEKAP